MGQSKSKFYRCQQCGNESAKWISSCAKCHTWGSLVEENTAPCATHDITNEKPIPIDQVKSIAKDRVSTGMKELDRIMGGGIVPGSATLIGGDPGIGKSTLLLQVSNNICPNKKVLYITAEESVYQTKLRAERLGITSSNILLVSEGDVDIISGYVESHSPDCVIIDSIQMVHSPQLPGAPGSLAQMRESAMDLIYLAKHKNISLFLIGHVTKEGVIAGPRTLEHMVDTVLYFEGDRDNSFRVLRAVKNRFGSTNEIGMFEMNNKGLSEIINPSSFVMDKNAQAGSVIMPAIIGTRPLIVEIQALVVPMAGQSANRHVSGVNYSRVLMIIAIMERWMGMSLASHDIYINVIGGLKIDEPAADLAIAMAIISSLDNKPIPADTVMIGEIGLTGEVRSVDQTAQRINEAKRLGFKNAYIPKKTKLSDEEINLIKIGSLQEITP